MKRIKEQRKLIIEVIILLIILLGLFLLMSYYQSHDSNKNAYNNKEIWLNII